MTKLYNQTIKAINELALNEATTTEEKIALISNALNNDIEVKKELAEKLNNNIALTREELDQLIIDEEDITKANVSEITDFSRLFRCNETFNQDISGWDLSNATTVNNMFFYARSFNQDISGWDLSKVTEYGFYKMMQVTTSFNQDLSKLRVPKGCTRNMFGSNCSLSRYIKDYKNK